MHYYHDYHDYHDYLVCVYEGKHVTRVLLVYMLY